MFNFSRFKKTSYEIDKNNLPVHIAIIMDGNGRWAKRRGLSRSLGHREGSNVLKRITEFCSDLGIKYLTVYAFSTENWKRPKSEVDKLMDLLLEYLKKAEDELSGKNIRIKVIGDKKGLPLEIQKQVERVEKFSRENTGLCLNMALNYGSRNEIINAAKLLIKDCNDGKIKVDDIDENLFSDRLYTTGIPDPDLLIRPSGEQRISNFLLWQAAYTEFWYSNVMWPDFKKEHLLEAIRDYQNRNRRFGGI
ncbi:MAG: isoprenyl transferase [Clostridia bacterium]|nr:isoprenyl transferase [Clostridia bacterium]